MANKDPASKYPGSSLHDFNHPYNTKFKKDPAIERWVFQRYIGQYGKFDLGKNTWSKLKWLTILYGVVPVALFYGNESWVRWLDDAKVDHTNHIRFGRPDPTQDHDD